MTSESASPKYTVLMPSRWGWFVGMKNDPFQTGSIATMGEWSPCETNLIRSFIRRGDTVIDCGANVGNITLAIAAAVGDKGRVLSFEPQRFCYLCLCANVALNSLMHVVEPYQMAVSDAPGQMDVPILNPIQEITNYGGVSLLDTHTTVTEKVNLVTIDSLQVPSVRLIKMDIEGMEPHALRGGRETIMRLRPVIWLECLEDRHTREPLKQLFAEFNYRAWKFANPLFSAENARGCRHNLFRIDDYNEMQDHNVLALPREAPSPDWINVPEAEMFCK